MEEKVKRKGKPNSAKRIILLLACIILVSLFGCGAYINQYLQSYPYMEVAMLNGMYSEEIEDFLLERLPIGTSRETVESFIAEYLQPSKPCTRTSGTGICQEIMGRQVFCSFWIWYISFYFVDNRLSDISIEPYGGCL